MLRVWFTVLILLIATSAAGASLRFYGHGVNDIDRVKIRIDDPQDNSAGPPADIGATDFTIEFWIRPSGTNNGTVACDVDGYTWISGNIIYDRDRFGQGQSFGIALGNGRIAFGLDNGSESRTICGTRDLRDGAWHHVVVQRQFAGLMEIYVDGQREASANGPPNDISYPDDELPDRTACGGPCDDSDPFIVLGAEKHDVNSVAYPAYSGWLTELRLSTTRRYTTNFTVPTARFNVDGSTAALYHFVDDFGTDVIVDARGLSNGVRLFGGSAPAGPEWSTESPPFGSSPPPPPSPGTLQLTQSTYTVDEQNATVTVTVRRVGGSSGTASVEYAVTQGTATAGADFDATSGMLTWADGDATDRSFTIAIRDDSDPEPNETVNIALSNALGASLGSPSSAVLTITDNDSSGGGGGGSGGSGGGGSGGGGGGGSGSSDGGGGGGAFDVFTWSALLMLFFAHRRRFRARFL